MSPSDTQFVHLGDIVPRPGFLHRWEGLRHRKAHWFVECTAEFLGAFIYCFAGIGSQAAYVVGTLTQTPGLGSLLQIGLAYAFGVALAIIICGSTSGGHFSPGVTIAFTLFKGFPASKAPRYIIAQILGAYIACLVVYLQYKGTLKEVEAALATAGKLDAIQFTPNGPAGIFGFFLMPGSNIHYVLLNEFMADFFLGVVIWACLDPTNFFCPPAAVPWIIGFAFAVAIFGYAPIGLAANSARDIGGRLAALSIYGSRAGGGSYAALTALTNILALNLAAVFYEIFFTDSCRVLPPAQLEYLKGHKAHLEHREHKHGNGPDPHQSMISNDEEKGRIDTKE